MWTRGLLKENAKIAFKRNYWTCVIVSVILMLVGGGVEGGSFNLNFNTSSSDAETLYNITGKEFILFSVILIGILIVLAVSCVFAAFITNIVNVGGKRYFMENREHKTQIGQVFYGFQCGSYMNLVKTMFLRDLYIFGWSLLLIIPGIIKSYAYKLVPYILAENPELGSDKAIELSNTMMKGNKLELWVLELSFILWDILNACTIGLLGVFYLNPYKHATYTEFYTAVKAEAIGNGVVDPMYFPGVSYPQAHSEFVSEEQVVFTQEVVDEEDIFAE